MARRRLGFLPLARESASFVRGAFGVPFVRTRLADRPLWEALTRGAEYGIGTRTTVLPVAARLRLLPDRGALAPRCANRTSLALRLVTAPAESVTPAPRAMSTSPTRSSERDSSTSWW